jgi:hypothetical protein
VELIFLETREEERRGKERKRIIVNDSFSGEVV